MGGEMILFELYQRLVRSSNVHIFDCYNHEALYDGKARSIPAALMPRQIAYISVGNHNIDICLEEEDF